MTRREQWSMATPTHQQKGQTCGKAKGIHATQNPRAVGTVVRSTCQRSFGLLAVMTRRAASGTRKGFGDRGGGDNPRARGGPRGRAPPARKPGVFARPPGGGGGLSPP